MCGYETECAFTWVLVIMGTSEETWPPLWPQGFNRDHLSTWISLKHTFPRKGSLPVISLTYHCCPDLILFCSALANLAYFSLLKKYYSFIIKDEAAPVKGAARFAASTRGLLSEDRTSVIWSCWASVFWFGNPGYLYLACLFHSATVRFKCETQWESAS